MSRKPCQTLLQSGHDADQETDVNRQSQRPSDDNQVSPDVGLPSQSNPDGDQVPDVNLLSQCAPDGDQGPDVNLPSQGAPDGDQGPESKSDAESSQSESHGDGICPVRQALGSRLNQGLASMFRHLTTQDVNMRYYIVICGTMVAMEIINSFVNGL